MEKLSFKDPYPESLLSELAENYPETFIVAEARDSGIVGYAVAKRGVNRHHLLSIAVLPTRKRSGIGQRLLASLEERLGPGVLTLELRRTNSAAFEFYEQNGFTETGIARRYYHDGEDAVTMQKTIQKIESG